MTISSNGWSSNSDRDFSSAAPQTTDAYELSHSGKPLKALIGLAILVVFAVALAFMNPASHDTATAPAISTDHTGSAITHMNREPGRTTGQAPASGAN